MIDQKYPMAMHHPHHTPAVLGTAPGEGKPALFPPLEVNNEDQEEEARAKGYLRFGETPERKVSHLEYPKMMRHPQHREAEPEQQHAKKDEDGRFVQWSTPGSPELYPHAIVNSPDEEEAWLVKGYEVPGTFDEAAYERAHAVPYVVGFEPGEWPKWVDGVLVDDPNRPVSTVEEYPKWVGDRIVNSRAEELALLGDSFAPVPEPEPPSAQWEECMSAWLAAADRQTERQEPERIRRGPGRPPNRPPSDA